VRFFLSYRREDSSAHAGRLRDSLVPHFGHKAIFQDVVDIDAGEDSTQAIERELDNCDAVLVVIGPGWLTPSTPGGSSRLEAPDDYVRIEVAAALGRGVKVVPVLVGGAAMPTVDNLPDTLSLLTHRQAVVLHDETWHRDIDDLVRSLRGESRDRVPRRRWLTVGAAALGVVIALGAAFLLNRDGGILAGSEALELSSCATVGEPWMRLFGPDGAATAEQQGREYVVTGAVYKMAAPGNWEIVLDTIVTDELTAISHGWWHYDRLVIDGFPSEDKSCFSTVTPNPNLGEKSQARIGFAVTENPNGSVVELFVDFESDDSEPIELTSN